MPAKIPVNSFGEKFANWQLLGVSAAGRDAGAVHEIQQLDIQVNFNSMLDKKSLAFHLTRVHSLNTLSTIRPVVASESGINGTNFVIRWQSTVNIGYQVQESTHMQIWTDVGQPVIGNGAFLSWSAAIGSGSKFYRIVQL